MTRTKNDLQYLDALEQDIFFSVPDVNLSGYDQVKKLNQDEVFAPDLKELNSLARIIHLTKRTTVLEFGCGWSSLVFAASLSHQESIHGNISMFRRTHPYKCYSVDDSKKYINESEMRISKNLKQHINFCFSEIQMCSWNGRTATEYLNIPSISPDLIYIDAPSQFGIKGNINGFNTGDHDLLPMMCDILKIEYFLLPKTIIVIDGRKANTEFIKNNLQRKWEYKHCPKRDQHFLLLDEEPLGELNRSLINNHYFKDNDWNISDL
jgi:hypothetical protein